MKKIQNFQEGVEQAKRMLKLFSQTGPLAPIPITMPNGFKALVLQMEGSEMISKNPTELIEKAKNDPDYFDAIRFGIAVHLVIKKELPQIILDWLIEHLRGKTKRPRRAAGRGISLGLHVTVAQVVQVLVDRGMHATRNDASPATSACDAVAEALSDLKMTPNSFEGVKAVWLRINRATDEHGVMKYSV